MAPVLTAYLPQLVDSPCMTSSCPVLQLAPFPFDLVMRELRRYPNAEVMWCQEEPMNMGAYQHAAPRIETCMRHEGREVGERA